MARWKRTNNDLQSITQKAKDRVTRIALKTRMNIRCSGKVSRSSCTCDICYKPGDTSWMRKWKWEMIYPHSWSHIYLNKSTTLPYIVIYTWINLLDRVHKSYIFTMIHITNFEMHKYSNIPNHVRNMLKSSSIGF